LTDIHQLIKAYKAHTNNSPEYPNSTSEVVGYAGYAYNAL